MIRKDLEKLLRHVEEKVMGILAANGLVTGKKFSDMKLTQQGKAVAGFSDPLITEEWIQEWRNLWPRGYRGTASIVRDKLNRFLLEHDVTLENIVKATKLWLETNQTPYHGDAKNFFYKKESDSEVSRCEEYLELLKEDDVQASDDKPIFI